MRYYAYGGTRSGTMDTDRRYTGQRWEAGIGLYDYNARYYDPALARFVQADTIVPSPHNPQSFNRYLYTLGNPLKYNDPDGHIALAVGLILLAGGVAGIADWGFQVKRNMDQGMSFIDAAYHQNLDVGQTVNTAVCAASTTALVVTAAPVVVTAAGQGLMSAGVAWGSSTLINAGASTVAAGGALYSTLWSPMDFGSGSMSSPSGGLSFVDQMEAEEAAGYREYWS
jgi:RHS repeat-associated protein